MKCKNLTKLALNFFWVYRKVLIVLEVSVIKPANEVRGKIGDPKSINTDSAQQQQLQQNGSGPHQNMSGKDGVRCVCWSLIHHLHNPGSIVREKLNFFCFILSCNLQGFVIV